MKKLAFVIVFAGILSACNTKNDSTTGNSNLVPLDSAHSYNNSAVTDTPQNVKSMTVANDTAVVTTTTTKIPVTPKKHQVTHTVPTAPVPTANPGAATTNPAPATMPVPTTASAPVPAAEPEKKKGLSNSAKGAIIGTGAGAVTGGIIGKNVKGALIGGALGAAGGYIIGRQKDKKDGRVKKDTVQ